MLQVVATCLLLFTITAGSNGRLLQNKGAKENKNIMEISLKDLVEAENPMNPRAYSGICDVNYVKIGCYKDKKSKGKGKQKKNPALPEELFQDRKSKDPNYSGQDVDWADYSTYLKGLACRCAQKSQENGFTHFGLQDYGRCFSGPHAASSFDAYGSSKDCSDQHYSKCDDNAWGECVGKKKEVNYVYEIKEAGSADGEIGYGKAFDEMDGETKQR